MEDDRFYIQAVVAGQRDAFTPLVRKYQRPVYYLALRMLKNSELADDVTQKTFLKAYRALGNFQFQSSLKTWLSAIALNLCRSELSRKKPDAIELSPNLLDPSSEDLQQATELDYRRDFLEDALNTLPLRQKEVVTLRIYQELPFKEIAQALESTESAVKVNFHHALKSLRQRIIKRQQREAL